jgi:N-acetylmuramoyl-L-alanine amidase
LVALVAMAGLAISVVPHGAGAADFAVGDTVVVDTDALNLRADVGTDADVVTVLENGTTATVTDGPQDADGYTWYKLDVADGSAGWAAGDFLALAGAQDPGFAEGDRVAVVDGALNLRDDAGLSANILDVMADGSTATVLSGPVSADGLPWYQLDTDDYGQGWAAGGFLALASDETFPVDAALIVQTGDGSNLNLREEPTIDGALIDKLPDGSRVVVLDGPQSADGYDWYQLDTDLGTGWAAGEFLAAPTDAIAVGDTVTVVDGTLNLRDDAGLSANVIDQLPDGTVLEVSDGPVSADGYTWFEVSNDDFGPGWVAGEFLEVNASTGDETPTTTATTTATATETPPPTPTGTPV